MSAESAESIMRNSFINIILIILAVPIYEITVNLHGIKNWCFAPETMGGSRCNDSKKRIKWYAI
jgi:hypothetical protein